MESKSSSSEALSVSAILDQLWVKFLPQLLERVTVIEQAAAALEHGNLSADLRAAAHSAAHKLAGSLGTFGVQTGTNLAREAESLLAGDSPISPDSSARLDRIVSNLNEVIQTRS